MASMKGTRLPKCVVLGELVWGQEKKWMGCFLDVLRTFGINADSGNDAGLRNKERNISWRNGSLHIPVSSFG